MAAGRNTARDVAKEHENAEAPASRSVVAPVAEADGADLGGSSKYSNENFEGRRGERFHVNGTCTWVSRSYGVGEARHTTSSELATPERVSG
ncbi:hypothetical protein FCM35_KLT22207 [Carex littledalei]|uniref:Uncharacterized protein n=1 Tax=Carex littledalei TaxID=544730 RepID=A0A833Q9L5_9POAL|nr:hypothetical protein FCM35_KLT22207 [Carex littledalei]